MRNRCNNPNNSDYGHYGGKGIKVCERWNSFENFLLDMGDKPSPNVTLDRIDPYGNYEPSNCRWATLTQQAYNKLRRYKPNRGVTFHKSTGQWQARIQIGGVRIYLGVYKTEKEAIQARYKAEEHLIQEFKS